MNKLHKEMVASQLHQEGLTQAEIGAQLGLSRVRAGQMIQAHEAREAQIGQVDKFTAELICSECQTSRVLNTIRNAGCEGRPDKIAALGPVELRKMSSLGQKSLDIIANILERIGQIDEAKQWLRRSK